MTVSRHLNVSTRCLHVQLGCCVVLATCGDQVIEAGLQVVNRLALVETAPGGMPPVQRSVHGLFDEVLLLLLLLLQLLLQLQLDSQPNRLTDQCGCDS